MRSRALLLALATCLPALSLTVLGTATAAAVEFTPCPEHFGFSCTTVTVPLDRSGTVPGSIALKVERKQASLTPSKDAVIALSGGPGQAAVPSAEEVAKATSQQQEAAKRDQVGVDDPGEA